MLNCLVSVSQTVMNFHLLGQVMVDKNPGITSAVNKTSNIDNTYRNFQMEVLCGEENMLTKVLPCLPIPREQQD